MYLLKILLGFISDETISCISKQTIIYAGQKNNNSFEDQPTGFFCQFCFLLDIINCDEIDYVVAR